MMAHFAEINEQGAVVQVIVVNNEDILDENGQESEAIGKQFCTNLLGGEWVQTSYNGNMRKQYASIGGSYDGVNDVFIAPKPYPSWSLDENFDWQAPVPYPTDGDGYVWDEVNRQWASLPTPLPPDDQTGQNTPIQE
jgi:hypothetical protein